MSQFALTAGLATTKGGHQEKAKGCKGGEFSNPFAMLGDD
jgi:hypothetical protein